MDQNPLSSGGTLLRGSIGLGSKNKPSIATTTNCQPPDHKYLIKGAGKGLWNNNRGRGAQAPCPQL